MVKEFTYHGLSKEELANMPQEKLLKLFSARVRRSLTRGINDDKRKLMEEMKDKNNKNPIKTHLRDVIILPYYNTPNLDAKSLASSTVLNCAKAFLP